MTEWIILIGGAAAGAAITNAIWLRKFREHSRQVRDLMDCYAKIVAGGERDDGEEGR